jgi:hypothetical protein
MKIKLKEDKVFRGRKLIATITDGEIKFKHYTYKKYAQEIKLLLGDGRCDDVPDPIFAPEIEEVEEVIEDKDPMPKTPMSLILEGEGRWYGESNPPAVEWRKANWSKEAFDKKYGHQSEHLQEVYSKHGLTYDRNDTSN